MATTTPSRTATTAEIAAFLKGELIGDGSLCLTGIAAAEEAGAGDLTFADGERHLIVAEGGGASAVIVSDVARPATKTLIRVPNARLAIATLLPTFFPAAAFAPGIHATAVVDPSATVDPTVQVGPHCVIGPGAQVHANVRLLGGNHLGHDCRIGEGSRLHPNVVLYPGTQVGRRVTIHAGSVIGSDGYGYVFDGGRHRKMPQVGHVVIGDDVEIGANAAIDRGALGSTVIGDGTKIDNLVHVAHNVEIGRHCLIMGQVGFAGSTQLGDYGVIASQSGIAGHLKLGTGATVGAKSGVMNDVPDRGTVLGIPAAPGLQAKRQMVAIKQLPELVRRVRELERQVTQLLGAGTAGSDGEA